MLCTRAKTPDRRERSAIFGLWSVIGFNKNYVDWFLSGSGWSQHFPPQMPRCAVLLTRCYLCRLASPALAVPTNKD